MARQRKAFLVGDRGFVLEEFTEQYKATSIPDYVEKIIEVSDRRVTFQDWKGFKTMVVHYIEWPTAASWSMMSMLVERLTLLMTGMMKFSGRYLGYIDYAAIFFGVIGKVDIVAVVPSAGSATAARVEASGIGALREAATHGWWQKRYGNGCSCCCC